MAANMTNQTELIFNGKKYRPFAGAFPDTKYDERLLGRPHARRIPTAPAK